MYTIIIFFYFPFLLLQKWRVLRTRYQPSLVTGHVCCSFTCHAIAVLTAVSTHVQHSAVQWCSGQLMLYNICRAVSWTEIISSIGNFLLVWHPEAGVTWQQQLSWSSAVVQCDEYQNNGNGEVRVRRLHAYTWQRLGFPLCVTGG